MGTEDFIALPASCDSSNENESNESLSCNETRGAHSQSSVLKCKDSDSSSRLEKVELADDVRFEDMHCIPQADLNDETQRSDSDMEIEDLNNLPDFSKTSSRSEDSKIPSEAEDLPLNHADGNIQLRREPLQQNELHSSFLTTGGQLTVTNTVSIDFNGFNSKVPIENGSTTSHHGGPSKIHKSDGSWNFFPLLFYTVKTNP